jgi:ribosomal protein L37AE/L43A
LHLLENSLVSALIDWDTKKWNRSLIEQYFLEEEREIILNIPLSPLLPKDKLIWRCTKNGDFSVRSAYHLGLDTQMAANPSSSMKSDDNEVWKVCWNSNVPHVVKTFIWLACYNLLPTKVNLCRRGVYEEASCPICLHEEETIEHIIWECASASDVWSGSNIKMQKERGQLPTNPLGGDPNV